MLENLQTPPFSPIFSCRYLHLMEKHPRHISVAYHDLISVIESFFDYARPAQHQKILRSALRAVQKNDYWKKRDPASLLEFLEAMQGLIEAVYDFVKMAKNNENDPFQAKNGLDPAILDSFHAFFRFRRYKAWKKEIRLILHFALSSTSHTSLGVEIDLLGIYVQFISLMNACHRLFLANTAQKQA